jgi:hypothetical protein
MADSAFLKGVMELYQGEVMGEVIFYELLRTAEDDNQRYKLATMLQLESETKARLRPWLFRHRLDLSENTAIRAEGLSMAENIGRMKWLEKMTVMHDVLRDRFIPRFKEIAEIAPPEYQEMARLMVEHESALLEMARREIAGMADRSSEPVVACSSFRYLNREPGSAENG